MVKMSFVCLFAAISSLILKLCIMMTQNLFPVVARNFGGHLELSSEHRAVSEFFRTVRKVHLEIRVHMVNIKDACHLFKVT